MNDHEHINVYLYNPNYGDRLAEQCATSFPFHDRFAAVVRGNTDVVMDGTALQMF